MGISWDTFHDKYRRVLSLVLSNGTCGRGLNLFFYIPFFGFLSNENIDGVVPFLRTLPPSLIPSRIGPW